MTRLYPDCLRCDRPFDLREGEPQYVYCPSCREAIRLTREDPALSPYVLAYGIVTDKRLEVMREEGSISSPGCRQLRRVLDYLDVMCDLETLEWPEVIGG